MKLILLCLLIALVSSMAVTRSAAKAAREAAKRLPHHASPPQIRLDHQRAGRVAKQAAKHLANNPPNLRIDRQRAERAVRQAARAAKQGPPGARNLMNELNMVASHRVTPGSRTPAARPAPPRSPPSPRRLFD